MPYLEINIPPAAEDEIGWTYSYGFLQEITEAVQNRGHTISQEAVEDVIDILLGSV